LPLGLLLAVVPAQAEQPYIIVASTTSTEQSGLFGHLLPAFTAHAGIEVRVVAVGTGQALKIGERGDADVVFVHDKASELQFLAAGYGVDRHDVMYNDFVLIGPKNGIVVTSSQNWRSLSTRASGGLPAMIAELIAPIEMRGL
jgi:tungstate transport system substrate-binding protein